MWARPFSTRNIFCFLLLKRWPLEDHASNKLDHCTTNPEIRYFFDPFPSLCDKPQTSLTLDVTLKYGQGTNRLVGCMFSSYERRLMLLYEGIVQSLNAVMAHFIHSLSTLGELAHPRTYFLKTNCQISSEVHRSHWIEDNKISYDIMSLPMFRQ